MYDIFPDLPEGPDTIDNPELDDSNGNNVDKKQIDIKKKSIGHLPAELLKFVNNDSYSLLIKGNPGTGKTTFALTLMDNLDHNSNYFYISTRQSIKQLSYFYPWVSKFTIPTESKYEYKFEDARLDEPESLFERITNQLMDVKSPIIIIDTWDAIASFMDRESRLNNERVLQIWRERAGAKLIFLSESCESTLLDSIVDGVITLKYNFKNSNYCRKLYINKLRGISIGCSRYNFSLFNGLFFVLDSIDDLNMFENLKINTSVQDKIGNNQNILYNKYNTYEKNNVNFLNDIFRSNRIVTMEFDSNLNNELILSMLLKPLFFWIVKENMIMINNFNWNFYSMLKKIMHFFVSSDLLDNNILHEQLNYLKFVSGYDENNKSFEEKKENLSFEDSINNSLVEILEMYKNKNKNKNKNPDYTSVLNILDGNSTGDLISNVKFVNSIKTNPINNLVILKNCTSINTDILLSESKYYKIFLKGKNILINSITPPTYNYGAINEPDSYFVDWYPLY
jgi:KaiC/GvpD/RAD55 family RecA-like ATPase